MTRYSAAGNCKDSLFSLDRKSQGKKSKQEKKKQSSILPLTSTPSSIRKMSLLCIPIQYYSNERISSSLSGSSSSSSSLSPSFTFVRTTIEILLEKGEWGYVQRESQMTFLLSSFCFESIFITIHWTNFRHREREREGWNEWIYFSNSFLPLIPLFFLPSLILLLLFLSLSILSTLGFKGKNFIQRGK